MPVSAELLFSKVWLTCAKFRVSFISAIYTVMNVVADKIVINAGICWTLKAIMTTIRGISESRDDHFEAVFVRTPRVRDVLEGDIVGLRVDDPILTHVCSGLVTTDTFLYKKEKGYFAWPKLVGVPRTKKIYRLSIFHCLNSPWIFR